MAPKKITDAEKAAEPVDACRVARRRARAFRRVRAAALIFSFWNLQY